MKNFITKHKTGLKRTFVLCITAFIMVSFVGLSSYFFTSKATNVSVSYKCHIQNIGWTGWVADDAQCGTTGQSLRMEAVQIKLNNAPEGMGVRYKAHVQNIGWQDWVIGTSDGATAGTTGRSLRMEALEVELTGSHPGMDIQYRAHVQNVGWQNYVTGPAIVGTTGQSLRIEAINIKLTPDSLQLTITDPTVALKPYDGNTTSTSCEPGTLSGLISGSADVNITCDATYGTSDIGTGKTVNVVYSITGADAANYIKPVDGSINTGEITTKQLTIAAPNVTLTKPYDGNTTVATCTPGELSGKIGSEDVTVTCVATYNNATVGTGKSITVVYTLGGANASRYLKPVNYTVVPSTITTKQLTIAAPTVTLSKSYDGGTTVATCTPGELSGKIGSEDVTVTCVATYATATVGTDKTINVVYTIDGTDKANYIKPIDGSVATGIILPVQLTPHITANDKPYDGDTTATLSSQTVTGMVSGETDVTLIVGAKSFGSPAIGLQTVTASTLSLGGTKASNYVLAELATATDDANITTKQLTIADPTVTLEKFWSGNNSVATCTPGTISGKIGIEDVTATCVATYDNSDVGTGKTINVVYTINGTDKANYIKPIDGSVATGVINANVITEDEISGLTRPVVGDFRVSTIEPTDQYTGTVTWAPMSNPFNSATTYTAWINLVPKTGYTLIGVGANFFTVEDATLATNAVNSGVITASFPATATINKTALTSAINFEYSDGSGRTTLKFVSTDYRTATWTPYADAIAAAKVTESTAYATQTAVGNATTAIGTTKAALELASGMTAYNAALAVVHQADYTSASWTTYQGVVSANVRTNQDTQVAVDASTGLITAAQASLVLQADQNAADAVTTEVGLLPAVANLAVGNTSVATAKGHYDALSAAQKLLVTNLSTLTAAEAQVTALNAADGAVTSAEGDHTQEKVDAAIALMPAVTAGTAKTALQDRIDVVQGEVNVAAAAATSLLITNLPAVGLLVEGDNGAVTTAENSYTALTTDQKALVANHATLTAARAQVNALIAATATVVTAESTKTQAKIDLANTAMESVAGGAAKTALQARIDAVQTDVTAAAGTMALITALPSVTNLVLGDAGDVTAARGSYDALSEARQALVTNYATLTAAETQMLALVNANAAVNTLEGAHTTGNKSAADAAVGLVASGGAKTALQDRINAVVSADTALANADKAVLYDNSIKGGNSSLSNVMVALASPLPSLGFVNDSAITWGSGTPVVVSNDGQTVIRPEFAAGNATVTFTATLAKGTATVTKDFTLTVIKKDQTGDVAFALTTPAAGGGNSITGGGSTMEVHADVVNDTSSVVITGTKTAGQTVVVDGFESTPGDSENVTVGGTATNPTYTVNMTTPGDNVRYGGDKTLKLTVSEAGKSSIVYKVHVYVKYPENVQSAAFTTYTTNNDTMTITLTNGTFKTGAKVAGDFIFNGTDATNIATNGTFTYINPTTVNVTGLNLHLAGGADNTVIAKGGVAGVLATGTAATLVTAVAAGP